jgi:hypothetical protein
MNGSAGGRIGAALVFFQLHGEPVRLPVLLMNLPQLAFEAMADYTLVA